MRGFYILLAAVGIGGAAWLVYAARPKPAERPAPTTPVPAAPASGFTGYTLGSDSAPVHITVYSDFQCPYCASFVTVQMPEVRAQLINTGKVQFRFRPFPLPSHQHSQIAALAAECAGEQGKYWQLHDRMFANQRALDATSLVNHGKAEGLDVTRFQQCLGSDKYNAKIRADQAESDRVGATSTPSFFVAVLTPGDSKARAVRMIRGAHPYPTFKAAIDGVLATLK